MQHNGRRVLLTQVIARHGDRSPSANLTGCPAEPNKWAQRLPPKAKLESLGRTFPVLKLCHDQEPKDANSVPFGSLTNLGGRQMELLGKAIQLRVLATDGVATLEPIQVAVQSTNYLRTQQSAQFLLQGLLSDSPDSAPTEATYRDDPEKSPKTVAVPVAVPDNCWINPFDLPPKEQPGSQPCLWARCAEVEEASARFCDLEDGMAVTRQLVESQLSGLGDKGGRASDVNAKFKWIKALDHFVCAESHGDGFWGELRGQKGLTELVRSHVAERFSAWFDDPAVLALMAAPLLEDLSCACAAALERDRKAVSEASRQVGCEAEQGPEMNYAAGSLRCRIILGHDVTLLALKKALERCPQRSVHGLAEEGTSPSISAPESGAGSSEVNGALGHLELTAMEGGAFQPEKQLADMWSETQSWPPYASALILELSAVDGMDGGGHLNSEAGRCEEARAAPHGESSVTAGAPATKELGKPRRYELRVLSTETESDELTEVPKLVEVFTGQWAALGGGH